MAKTENDTQMVGKTLLLVSAGKVKVTQSCQTLCEAVDCILPGSSVHGVLQARKLQLVGCHFLLQGSSQPRD